MEVKNNLRKIKLIFEYIFDGKIVLNQNYTEKLLKFLEDYTEKSSGKLLIDAPCFSDFVYNNIAYINNVNTSIKVLLIKVMTILFKNELQFNKMLMQGFQESFCDYCVIQNLTSNPPPDLHLACIKLLTVQVTHCHGLKLIMDQKLWQYVLQRDTHLKPIYISKAAYNFIAKLISTLNDYSLESDLLEVLGYVIEPIVTSEHTKLPVIDIQTDTELCEKIFSYMCALLAIMVEVNNMANSNTITSILKDHFRIDHNITKLFTVTKNQELLKLLNAFSFRLYFATARHLLFNNQVDDFCNKMAIAHRNYLMYYSMTKRDVFTIIDYVVQTNIIWSGVEKSHATELKLPLTFERNSQKFELTLQMVIHLVVPILKYAPMRRIAKKQDMGEVIEQFAVKIGKTIVDYIFASCHTFGSWLEEGGDAFTRKVVTQTLKELLRLKGHLNESQAGPIFQSLYYLLSIFILCDGAGGLVLNENPMTPEDLNLLTHLLDVMKMLLKEHNISWYENVEIVNVQADLLNLLKQNFLDTKQIVRVLDLIDICVKKFLSPSMSLLLENNNRQGNTLNEIGEVIRLYSQHDEWEVRDSAFNLLYTCTEIAFIKYIPLQKVIRDNNLIIFAAKAALTDTEFYSQCTALKCLTAATKMDCMWQEVLMDNVHVYLQLVYLLRNHSEAMVRKEAANVLTGVYANQKIELTLQNTLYEIMTTAALDDLHWEVQLAALSFWKIAIRNCLAYTGMLDGKFPSVTFSKEKRKIIVLSREEINRQLIGVMNHLSSIGCLTVLVECMNDFHNIDVMVQTHSVAKELIKILNTYKFEKMDCEEVRADTIPQQFEVDKQVTPNLNYINEEARNKVIDSILSVDRTDLIISLHDNSFQVKKDDMDIDSTYCRRRKLVHPNVFLEIYKNTDFLRLIESKKNFYMDNLGTLSALLDEILEFSSIV